MLLVALVPKSPEEVAQAAAREKKAKEEAAAEGRAEAEAAQAAAAKEKSDRISGFHCLSAWDGSNRSFVRQVKAQLRDPDSFDHDETRISPVKNGQHLVTMRYRARNGFGGMNVATAIGSVDAASCEATVLSTGE